jgi:DNA replicative helicase MCM subunit Mcm2 (Cdc46/Mcm family)
VNRCVPGDLVSVTGIMMVNDIKSGDNLSKGTFYVIGINKHKDRTNVKYTTQDE